MVSFTAVEKTPEYAPVSVLVAEKQRPSGPVMVYDAKPLIKGEWFGQLKDTKVFNTVHIVGLSVEWSGGQDVCPDDLYYSSTPVSK